MSVGVLQRPHRVFVCMWRERDRRTDLRTGFSDCGGWHVPNLQAGDPGQSAGQIPSSLEVVHL